MFESFDVSLLPSYIEALISGALTGDSTSIIMVAGIAIILIAIIFKASSLLFGIVKRGFLFIVILLSAYYFTTTFIQRFNAEGLTEQTLIIGVLGLVVVAVSLVIAIGSFFRQAKKVKKSYDYPGEQEEISPKKSPSAPTFTPTQIQQPQSYTSQALTKDNLFNSLKDDRSLLAVLSYVIIAQFGVFSSKTISAPNPEVGMMFFAIFFVGAFIFIKTTYHSYLKGITHLIIASIFGVILSMGLGIFWAEFPVEVMLSTGYFQTDALVAFVTGIAVSLLMGSKN